MGSRMAKALVGMCGLLLGMVFLPASGGAATPSVASWQQAIHALPLSSSGCFTAAFPVLQWRSVTCQTAPDVPFAPATSSSTPSTLSTVGNGVDYSALSSGGLLSSVTGSFPYVSPGITEKGVVPVTGDPKMHNTFSLQLNSSFFSGSPACSGASNPTKCEGWQQFVETTSPSTQSQSELFMQYWLIDYGTTCPAGWFTYSPDCYMNSATVPTSSLTAPGLASVSLEGSAAKGGNDIGTLTTRTNAYAVTGSDSVVDLASSWSAAEFGVFGDGDYTAAKFGAGTTLRIETATNNETTLAPTCEKEGFTGETNNLNLVKTPKGAAGSSPSIVSEQSNASTTKSSCVSSAG
jgi:hypothetical protein